MRAQTASVSEFAIGDSQPCRGPVERASPLFISHASWGPLFFGLGKRGLLEKGSFGKGVFWKRGLFRKVHFPEMLEKFRGSRDFREPETVENKGESGHFLEILETFEILEILEIPAVKRPLS